VSAEDVAALVVAVALLGYLLTEPGMGYRFEDG